MYEPYFCIEWWHDYFGGLGYKYVDCDYNWYLFEYNCFQVEVKVGEREFFYLIRSGYGIGSQMYSVKEKDVPEHWPQIDLVLRAIKDPSKAPLLAGVTWAGKIMEALLLRMG